jgi:hypothetical protein
MQVPAEFYPLLDTKVAKPDSFETSRRRKRSTTDVATNTSHPKATLFNTAAGRRLRRRRRDISLTSSSGSTMTVHVLLQFDGYRVNLTQVDALSDNATFLLHKPPIILLPSDVMPFYPNHDLVVEVEVSNEIGQRFFLSASRSACFWKCA